MTPPIHFVAVIFDKFELLDLYGPLELFGMLQGRAKISVVAERPGIIASNQGPTVVADASIYEIGSADVLLVPGGWGTRREVENAKFLQALKRLSEMSRYTASVCTGSALLAKSGVLDGRRATSNKRAFTWVSAQSRKVDWIKNARWIEDGPYFTSSGVSAGMDMALGLIARLFNREVALECATFAEYVWNEDSSIDPFAVQV